MPFAARTSSGQPETICDTNLFACCLAASPSRETEALSSMTLRSGSPSGDCVRAACSRARDRFHIADAVKSLQDHAVEVACDEIEHRRFEQTRAVIESDRRLGLEAQRVLFRVHMKI